MSSREEILSILEGGRARTAMQIEVPPVVGAELFCDFATAEENPFEHFKSRLATLSGECYRVSSVREAGLKMLELLKGTNYRSHLRQKEALVDAVFAQTAELGELLGNPGDLAKTSSQDLAKYEVGVSVADALVLRSASVVLRNTRAGGRRLSVLPHFHIVLARSNQFVPSLENWFSQIKDDKAWSYATIINGPSRTADIEKILVLGAHGPKRLVVIVVDELAN